MKASADGTILPVRSVHGRPEGESLSVAPKFFAVDDILSFGNIITADGGLVIFEKRRMLLTPRLHDFVVALVRAKGRGLTCSFLADRLVDDVTREAVIKTAQRARKLFRDVDPAFDQIQTVWGNAAYRWAYRPG